MFRLVNMAFLAVIGSKSTNGVAYIHSEIIKETIFKVRAGQPPSIFAQREKPVQTICHFGTFCLSQANNNQLAQETCDCSAFCPCMLSS